MFLLLAFFPKKCTYHPTTLDIALVHHFGMHGFSVVS